MSEPATATVVVEHLNPQQRKTLTAIRRSFDERGYPPSVRELRAILGVQSNSTVHGILTALTRAGWIIRDTRVARGIRVVDPPPRDEASDLADALTRDLAHVIAEPALRRAAVDAILPTIVDWYGHPGSGDEHPLHTVTWGVLSDDGEVHTVNPSTSAKAQMEAGFLRGSGEPGARVDRFAVNVYSSER